VPCSGLVLSMSISFAKQESSLGVPSKRNSNQ
jgi:hypothetical protein